MANQYTKKKDVMKKNADEIKWNIINSLLAGSLVFLGSFSDLKFSWKGLVAGLIIAAIVVVAKFKDYWDGEKKEYTQKLFKFL